jgi:hypothetical protein
LARERALSKGSDNELTVELGRAREALAGTQRALGDTQSHLDAERAAGITLGHELARAKEEGEAITQERVVAQASVGELTAELARAHEVTAAREHALSDAHSQLEAERVCGAELNQELERVEAELAALAQERTVAHASDHDMAVELARAREALAEAHAELDIERASHAEPRGPMERLELRVARVENVAARTTVTRAGTTEHASVTAPGRHGRSAREKERGGPSPVEDSDEAARPAHPVNRHAFRKPIEILVNGEPGLLFDVSVTGCQLQSKAMLKPSQGIRLVLTSGSTRIALKGKVAWARLELAVAGRPLGYRAGVEFTKPDTAAIEAFVASHAKA